MSKKKSTPGLMGDSPHWLDAIVGWDNVGARKILRSACPGRDDLRHFSDFLSLTGGGFGDFELMVLRDDLRKAGFPEYPTAATMAERYELAEQFTGAAPSIDDPRDKSASRAWVLAHLSGLVYLSEEYTNRKEIAGASWAGIRIGRLVEWWVWRHEGYDRQVVSRQGSDRGMKRVHAGGATENEERAQMRQRWVKWARKRAEVLNREKPSRTKSRLAAMIHGELATRDARIQAVDGDCGHDPVKPRRHCFVCSKPSEKTIANNIQKSPER